MRNEEMGKWNGNTLVLNRCKRQWSALLCKVAKFARGGRPIECF